MTADLYIKGDHPLADGVGIGAACAARNAICLKSNGCKPLRFLCCLLITFITEVRSPRQLEAYLCSARAHDLVARILRQCARSLSQPCSRRAGEQLLLGVQPLAAAMSCCPISVRLQPGVFGRRTILFGDRDVAGGFK